MVVFLTIFRQKKKYIFAKHMFSINLEHLTLVSIQCLQDTRLESSRFLDSNLRYSKRKYVFTKITIVYKTIKDTGEIYL